MKIFDNVFDEILRRQSDVKNSLRISVIPGGCAGFSYHYEMITQNDIEPDDIVYTKSGVKVILDQISHELIKDSEVEYINQIGNSGFTIKNPEAKIKCGCGKSFSTT